MRVLVLGADGFVGRTLVAALAASDWATPIAGSRRSGPVRTTASVRVDATDPASLAAALAGTDAVVNAIAGDAATITANAVALAGAAGGRRVVHLSSMAVYGSATGLLGEDAPMLADTGAYAAAKAAAERSLQRVAAVMLRPGCIYGAGSMQWSLRIGRLLAQRRVGDLGARGDGCSNVVHVDDVAAAALAALRGDAKGAFNLAMPGAPDWNDYFLAFARALGTVPIRRVPGWQLKLEKLAAIPLKLAEKAHLPAPPPIPPSLLGLWAHDVTLDPAQACAELRLDWTPLDRGLAEAAHWCAGRLQPASRS